MRTKFTLILSACALLSFKSFAPCTAVGPNSGTIFFNTTVPTGILWAQPQNAGAADGTFALVTLNLAVLTAQPTNYLTAQGFGFSIPTGATICGVSVSVIRQAQSVALIGSITDNSVLLSVGGTLSGTNHATATNWATAAPETVTYGGPTDTWGVSLTPALVNNANFGVGVSANFVNAILGLLMEGGIDYISMTVYYTTGTLPIQLQTFSATRQGSTNVLNWTATSDNQAEKFIVQRSGDSKGWQDIATVPAQTLSTQYDWTDNSPLSGFNFYRLFMKNADGNGDYSPIQEISQNGANIGITAYPNPIVNEINISSPVPIHNVTLRDLQGRTIQSKILNTSTNTVQLPATTLPPGIYLLQVDGTTFKMVKQ